MTVEMHMEGSSDHEARKARRRAVHTRREDYWLPEPSREDLLQALEDLAEDLPRERERSIAIIAEPNNGKSAIRNRYMELHPRCVENDRVRIPCIVVDMSATRRVEDLSVALLKALGDFDPENGTHIQRLARFVQLAREVGLQLVFLDEFHEAASIDKGAPILKCIKGLMNEHVKVVPIGVEKLAQVFNHDEQFSTRFQFARGRLLPITDLSIVKSLMVELCDLPEKQMAAKTVRYILKETRGILGHICDLIEDTYVKYGNLDHANVKAQRALMDCLNSRS